nr:hypothetical protein [Streptomyces sp. NK15101]
MTTQQTRRPRQPHRILPGLVAAGVAALLLTGCTSQERVCGTGRYPVKAVGNTDGQDCVADGQEPPEGWVRYPEGMVPEHVGDKWDKYWSTLIVDAEGRTTGGVTPTRPGA